MQPPLDLVIIEKQTAVGATRNGDAGLAYEAKTKPSITGASLQGRCCRVRIHLSYAVKSARIDELLKKL